MLNDWIINFVKNKDIFKKTIKNIVVDGDFIEITHKSEVHKIKVVEDLTRIDDVTSLLNSIKADKTSIVCYNSEQNFNFLLKNWEIFSDFDRKFNVIFVNEKSTKEKKWIVYPYTHHRLSENYKLGLQALYDGVDSL